MTGVDPHFFRHEFGRLVSVLGRVFGVGNLATCEDIAQETLCRAVEVWKLEGVPNDPSAWLTTSAKNRAIDSLRRERTRKLALPELARYVESEWTLVPMVSQIFEGDPHRTDELAMMFTLAQPRLPEASRVALVLRVLCGFGIDEIASALLVSPSSIEKRIQRGRALLGDSLAPASLEGPEIEARLEAVQTAIYLLFNEGYHSASPSEVVREDLCREAMRLSLLLAEHPKTSKPSSLALAALLFLHAARLPGRRDEHGGLLSFVDQDRSRWDKGLLRVGLELLDRGAAGDDISTYHLEAAIAAHHALAPSARDTPWEAIVRLYDALLARAPSPIVALNRAIAVGEAFGAEKGWHALVAIPANDELARYPFLDAALGEFSLRLGDVSTARRHFERAHGLARNDAERVFLRARVDALDKGGPRTAAP
ncbi:MAG: sigma-70 family RNA polymerase sigma factor [Myxococcota bacterium]|nr:sigma-70 family RNA polymerase sigma factor [Myxococcota bacterium]